MESVNNYNIRFYPIFEAALADLPDRSRLIVAKRFGIGEKSPLTLQAIGNEYGITRERVRQIVQSGLKSIQNAEDRDDLVQAKNVIIEHLKRNGGIAMIDDIIVLGGDDSDEHGVIRFFVEGIREINPISSKKYPVHENVVALADFDIETWLKMHDTVKSIFEEKNEVYTSKKLHEKISDDHDIDHATVEKYLTVSSEIGKNPFNKWGLYGWDEISPRGVREKALLIMKEKNKPMHFREITEAIDKYGLGKKGKKSHPQTVHNELIRDNNFVLVGRGVYAINTDSHVGGTVRDVIENILQNAGEPLTTQEVIDRVLELRYVQPSTVKVNLNAVAKKMNKKYTLDSKTA